MIKGAVMDPIRAIQEQQPMPVFRTDVGNNSEENK
jgi:hypothetical protein